MKSKVKVQKPSLPLTWSLLAYIWVVASVTSLQMVTALEESAKEGSLRTHERLMKDNPFKEELKEEFDFKLEGIKAIEDVEDQEGEYDDDNDDDSESMATAKRSLTIQKEELGLRDIIDISPGNVTVVEPGNEYHIFSHDEFGEFPYYDNMAREWEFVKGPGVEKIALECFVFRVQDSSRCKKDAFTVFKGPAYSRKRKYCGVKNNFKKQYKTDIKLAFDTDSSIVDEGFHCSIYDKESVVPISELSEAPCEGHQDLTATGEEQSVRVWYSTPPDPLPHECTWTIDAPTDYAITIEWKSFYMLPDSNYFRITEEYVSRQYTGTELPPTTVSGQTSTNVTFSASEAWSSLGGAFSYSASPFLGLDSCQHETVIDGTTSGAITVGTPSELYLNDLNCTWLVTTATSPDTSIDVTFDRFQLETFYDKLHVYDGSTGDDLTGALDGYDIPARVTVPSNQMTIVFTTDGSVQRNGFSLTYTAVESTTDTKIGGKRQPYQSTINEIEQGLAKENEDK